MVSSFAMSHQRGEGKGEAPRRHPGEDGDQRERQGLPCRSEPCGSHVADSGFRRNLTSRRETRDCDPPQGTCLVVLSTSAPCGSAVTGWICRHCPNATDFSELLTHRARAIGERARLSRERRSERGDHVRRVPTGTPKSRMCESIKRYATVRGVKRRAAAAGNSY